MVEGGLGVFGSGVNQTAEWIASVCDGVEYDSARHHDGPATALYTHSTTITIIIKPLLPTP